MRHTSPSSCLLIASLAACAIVGAPQQRMLLAAPGSGDRAATEIDEPTTPLKPLHPRTEADEDRLKSLALFAAGRMSEQRQDQAGALKFYERALRYDPGALPVLREIVPLAFSLDRQAEAVCYALMIVEKEPTDSVLLRRLGIYLTEEGDWQRALKLYERAAAVAPADKPSSTNVLLWMEIGRLSFLSKNYEQAAANFRRVVKVLEHPGDFKLDDSVRKAVLAEGNATYSLFGETFLEAGATNESTAAFKKANEFKANEGQLAFNLARIAVKEKNFAEAQKYLDTALEKRVNGQGAAPFELLAEILQAQGQEDKLDARLDKLRSEQPDNVPLAYYVAQRLRQASKLDKAEPIYRALIEKNGKRPPVEAFRGLLLIYQTQKKPDAALRIVADAVARSGSLGALGEEGRTLLADGDFAKQLLSVAEKERAANAEKLDYGVCLTAALLAIETKQYDKAGEFFELAIKAEPKKKAELLMTWGLDLFVGSEFAAAAKVFQRGVDEAALPPENPAFYFYLAGALEMNGQTDEALAAARTAAEAQKDSARFHSRVAWIQYHAKRLEDSKQTYQALLKKFDTVRDSSEVRDVLHDARLALSNIAVTQNDVAQAEEWLEQVLDEFPEDIGALNDLGYIWSDQGKHLHRSLDMVQKAVAADPDNKAYRDSLGWAFHKLGRHQEAVIELRKAADVKEPDGVILDHLADALFKLDETQAAIDHWTRAVESFDKQEDTAKASATREKIEHARKKRG